MKAKPAPSNSAAGLVFRLFSSLFFVPFVAIPMFMLYVGIWKPYVTSQEQRAWVQTRCRIVSVQTSENHDKHGVYYVDRIGFLYRVNDSEHRQTQRSGRTTAPGHSELAVRFPKNSKCACLVNPKNPAEAVLTPARSPLDGPGLLIVGFIAAFMLLGLFMTIATILGIKPGSRRKAPTGGGVAAGTADWTDRPDWAAGRVVSTARKTMLGIGIFAAAWNAFSWPVGFMVLTQSRHNDGAYFVLLFPVVGVCLLCWFIKLLTGYLKYGESVFEMTTVPGAIGGALEGVVRLQRPIRPTGPVTVRLNCLRITRGSKNEASETVVWQREEQIEMDSGDAIPVAVFIPEECEPTVVTGSAQGIAWRLEVQAPDAGGAYFAQFEVPVFAVALTPAAQAEARKVQAQEEREIALYTPPPDFPIRVGPSDDGGTQFYFPAARNPGMAVLWTLVFGILCAVPWFILSKSRGLETVAAGAMALVFGLFALVFGAIALKLWFGKTWVVATPDGLTVTNATLFHRSTRTIPVSEISDVKTNVGLTAGKSVYYDLKVHFGDDETAEVGSGVRGGDAAQWLSGEMKRALKLVP